MPATSKAQYRYMAAIAHGMVPRDGPTRAQAAEYVKGQGNYRQLPARATKKRKGRRR
jgi:hypothetical protein